MVKLFKNDIVIFRKNGRINLIIIMLGSIKSSNLLIVFKKRKLILNDNCIYRIPFILGFAIKLAIESKVRYGIKLV